ncbi:MAG: hypothetical protein GX352_00640 [Clostridiales bacterium]|nr:hypothetical protein [Clostridiales bacterium]
MESNYAIYILLSHTGTLPSKFIKMYTREPYSHVSIALDPNLDELYSFGRLNPYNPIVGGFIKEDILYGTFGRFPKTKCALYRLPISKFQHKRLKEELNKFVADRNKYGYNFIGLFTMTLGIPMERKYKFFCSQFVATLLNRSGITLLHKSDSLATPMDFRTCQGLSLIYEGGLREYAYCNQNPIDRPANSLSPI